MLNWRELYERLGISERTLHYLRTGARNPSPKLVRRIVELERESGLASPSTVTLACQDSRSEYVTNRDAKQLDIVELRAQIAALKQQLAALEDYVARFAGDSGKEGSHAKRKLG